MRENSWQRQEIPWDSRVTWESPCPTASSFEDVPVTGPLDFRQHFIYLGKISWSNISDILSKDTRTNPLLTLRNWLKTSTMLTDSKCSSPCSWNGYLYWLPWDQTSPLFSPKPVFAQQDGSALPLPLEKSLTKVWDSVCCLLDSWSMGHDPLQEVQVHSLHPQDPNSFCHFIFPGKRRGVGNSFTLFQASTNTRKRLQLPIDLLKSNYIAGRPLLPIPPKERMI